MKEFIKRNIKVIVAFIVGVVSTIGGVYATNEIVFSSSQVSVDNTRAGLTKANGDSVETLNTKKILKTIKNIF